MKTYKFWVKVNYMLRWCETSLSHLVKKIKTSYYMQYVIWHFSGKEQAQVKRLTMSNCNRVAFYLLLKFFLSIFFLAFIVSTAKQMTGNRMRERGGSDSDLGPLQRGQSLCTWDTCATNWAEQHPTVGVFKVDPHFEYKSNLKCHCCSISDI